MIISPSNWSSSGTLSVIGGGTLTLSNNWSNTGRTSETNSTLVLDGTFTTASLNVPNFVRSGGTVNLNGTLNNAGATLPLTAATGDFTMTGGVISGGTITPNGRAAPRVSSSLFHPLAHHHPPH